MESDPSVLEKTGRFLNVVLRQKHFSGRHLNWQYHENPDGMAIAFNAVAEGRVVGHYAAQPMQVKINGKTVRALFILNAAVDPAHQGQGILRRIADAVHEKAVQDGYACMLGVGNKNSTPIYTKSFGFTNQGPLDVNIGLGFPKRTSPKTDPVRRIWTKEALKWRLSRPDTKYLAIKDGEGYAVTHDYKSLLSIYLGHYSPDLINDNLRRTKLARPVLYIGLDPGIEWRREKTIAMPDWLKPSPLILITKDLDGRCGLDRGSILVNGLDIDAF